MSSFLSRLATRVLAPESAIRPRVPGPFEPASEPLLQVPAQSASETPKEPSFLSTSPAAEPPLLSRNPSPPEKSDTQESAIEPFPHRFPRMREPKATEPKRTVEHPESAEGTRADAPRITIRTNLPISAAAGDRLEPSIVPSAQWEPPESVEDSKKEPPPQPPILGPLIRPTAVASPDRRERLAPAQIRVFRDARMPPEVVDKTAPSIKVTIGRIEVRAIQAAEPRKIQPSAPPQPRLSLDEYLHQRREGKR